ncbi:hypothetical protein DM01DRAFT_1336500 [Hesseltinella vesiculosa]|uniref:Uncharacterized protein n=1 Tax=Hesseltinella vesiculosa TaxID=101127 RepID=A0A1X2GFK9_9FUNG|nr:hypothetical protein DM01DRAFT_1336500 [Hesseltinella vesiculosa]
MPRVGKELFFDQQTNNQQSLEKQSLEAMVAVCHFLIEGKTSLISMDRRDDQTIQLLYRIAKRIFSQEVVQAEAEVISFDELYFHAHDGLSRTKNILLGNHGADSTKRAIECLDDHIAVLDEIHRKRFAATSPDPTDANITDLATAAATPSIDATVTVPACAIVSTSSNNNIVTSSPVTATTMPIEENGTNLTIPTSTPSPIKPTEENDANLNFVPASPSSHDAYAASSSAVSSANILPTARAQNRRLQQDNWTFVDAYRTEHGSNMDWEQCFVQGKEKGLFKKYTTAKSVKAVYCTEFLVMVCAQDKNFSRQKKTNSQAK